jgi:hypothetical protein
MYVEPNIEALSRNHCWHGKAKNIKYHECVFVALIIQPTKYMRRVMLSVACLAVAYLSTLSHKRHDFRGKSY